MKVAEKKARVTSLAKEISKHEDAIAILKMSLEPLQQEIACEQTGFNIGDIIESAKGKGRVLEVHARDNGTVAMIWAQRILKSGKDGLRTNVYSWDEPRVIERAK